MQDSLDSGNTKPLWNYIANQRQASVGVSPLKEGSQMISDSLGKAELLNKQFKYVFTTSTLNSDATLFGPNHPSVRPLYIDLAGVQKLLSQLNPSKAAGPDNISCRILKELHMEIAPILCAIFEQSLETGDLPTEWLNAYVTPVFKKGARCLPSNYRPISLTCVPCKILEHIICRHIRYHLDEHGIISKFQHGFRSKHSCETQPSILI